MVFAPYIALGFVAQVLIRKKSDASRPCLMNTTANTIIAHNYEHGELAT